MADSGAQTSLPWAAQRQEVVTDADRNLTAIARNYHPRAKWWWGQRITEQGREGICHLCGAVITTWAGNWPMTRKAVHQVMLHRAMHMLETLGIQEEDLTHG